MRILRDLFIFLFVLTLCGCLSFGKGSKEQPEMPGTHAAYDSVEQAIDVGELEREKSGEPPKPDETGKEDRELIEALITKPIVVEVPFQNFFRVESAPTDVPEETEPAPQTFEEAKEKLQSQLKAAEARLETENFQNSEVIYNYLSGIIYPVFTSKNRVTDIFFEHGEVMMTAPVVGDKTNWKIEPVAIGKQLHLYLKPRRAGQSTNMIINTNKRVYRFNIISTEEEFMPAVSFSYDFEQLYEGGKKPPVDEGEGKDGKDKKKNSVYQRIVDMAMTGQYQDVYWDYKFRYTKNKKYMPAWMPTQAFDDGMRTYLFVPSIVKMSTRPVVMSADAKAKKFYIVNYRINGKYYIIDGVFDTLILASGYDKKERVIISRNRKPI